jgi:hypothetical protein
MSYDDPEKIRVDVTKKFIDTLRKLLNYTLLQDKILIKKRMQ